MGKPVCRITPPRDVEEPTLFLPPLRLDGSRLIPKREMLAYAGDVSYPAVWNWVRAGTFPSPRQVGSRVFWVESELAAWIIARPVADWAKAKGAA